MFKRYLNNPAHLFIDNSPYFITAAIYQKRNLLVSDFIKNYLIKVIQESFAERNWLLKDWVILDNHYHLLAISDKGTDLSKIINKIHTLSSQFICSELNAEKPIWWNYWDYCPRDERDYYIRLNYLYNNPVKHGLVTNLLDYPYSSFHSVLNQYGREALIKQFKDYSEYKNLQLDED
ncbi:REP-associated tyrosine transposase [Patescibacteria group bacterium]|nr:REP-associated tyrosine transposase [Patescibacteria group bacterium]